MYSTYLFDKKHPMPSLIVVTVSKKILLKYLKVMKYILHSFRLELLCGSSSQCHGFAVCDCGIS